MLFNSFDFLVFAVLFFSLWPLFRKQDNLRWGFIVFASFIFYGWWDWRFLFLILFSGLVDYFAGLGLRKKKFNKKMILGVSLGANLGALFIFKYAVFFATVIEDLVAKLGYEAHLAESIPEFALILPVGISFYTFQSLSYTIDIYRGRLEPTRNVLHFFAYLVMFPQLVAGPIIRAKDFLKQLKSYHIPNDLEKWNATKMICYGLFQKVVIADNLSYFIDSAFEGKTPYDGTLFWWTVAIAFSFQIYADFSGYSLMARGLAKMMGYHFKMNFNHPYLATSIKQFWSKWHISLSTWFRDYVYIPLGGSRNGIYMGIIALFITMMLSGIWHGANYTFIAWAGLHIIYQLIERYTKWNKKLKHLPALLTLIIFLQVTVAWVYFRANDINQGTTIIKKLFSLSSSDITYLSAYLDQLIYLYLAIVIEMIIRARKNRTPLSTFYSKHRDWVDVAFVSLSIIMILLFRGEGQQFIYFQF
ncbi:MBOAT family O-acyltransferase [Parvicella tangerina]|uniref:Peptidoglycan O-acetyltransferase n=1 Tax=Parvicella tangerina TaxID=2829795 RepID=A0A916JMK1_9FLAO|nr:MBOAT family O-acyltransferase [Parvicella tangerina]CAG5080972.1 Peptidoglycan O-acetyltransferase [Parvicella tangerina]